MKRLQKKSGSSKSGAGALVASPSGGSRKGAVQRKRIAIIGVGLIGGSLAIQLHEKKLSSKLIGVDASPEHAQKAVEMELVDETLPLDEAIMQSEVIILAIPVDKLVDLLPSIMDKIDQQIVIDLG
ncbi:MAG: prephenate dehydrogenase/arogenate dehydrogenase family protein, partial [Chitinophagaceae bacterium]